MIKIENIIVPTKGTGKYLEVRAITFNLTPTNGISLYWAIYSKITIPAAESDEQPSTRPGALLLDGNLHMPQEQYELWGTDDSYVIEWAAQQLNLTII